MESVTIAHLKEHNVQWFAKGNKRFFGDKSYKVMQGKSGKSYLVRLTSAWTDMFDGVKKDHYRINSIDPETLKIGTLVEGAFKDIAEVKEWLKEN